MKSKKQRKILVFTEVFPPRNGGSGRWIWELYSRLPPKEIVFLAGKCPNSVKFDSQSEHSIKRISFPLDGWAYWGLTSLKSLKFYLNLCLQILKNIKGKEVEEIHCGRIIPEATAVAFIKLFKKVKLLAFIHGEDVENATTSRSLKIAVNLAIKNSDILVCNSENTKRVLLDNWNVDEDIVILETPGVDIEKFIPAKKSYEVKKKYNWDSRKVILTISRLELRKGHDTMIKGLVNLKAEHPNILYSIVGDGPDKDYLVDLVQTLGLQDYVQFLFELTDEQIVECYQQADIFVLPNRDIGKNIEGFGMVMLESQACGTMVIGGKSGGTPETLIENKTGFIVDCRTEEQLAKKVSELLNNPKQIEQMNINARIWAESFSWKNKVKRFFYR